MYKRACVLVPAVPPPRVRSSGPFWGKDSNTQLTQGEKHIKKRTAGRGRFDGKGASERHKHSKTNESRFKKGDSGAL